MTPNQNDPDRPAAERNPSPVVRAQSGLRPHVPSACRAAVGSAEAERVQHLAQCATCRQHEADAAWLGQRIAVPPKVPAQLLDPAALDRVLERVVVAAENSALGEWLSAKMPVRSPADLPHAPDLDPVVAGLVAAPPAMPSPDQWMWVEAQLLAASRGGRSAHRRAGGLILGVLAAAAIIAVFFVSDGTQPEPAIVFADLEAMPNSDFALLRHGLSR